MCPDERYRKYKKIKNLKMVFFFQKTSLKLKNNKEKIRKWKKYLFVIYRKYFNF